MDIAVTAAIELFFLVLGLLSGFGEDAPFQAGFHADECLENGDMDGARAWRMVICAIEEMQLTYESLTLQRPGGGANA